MVADGYKDTEIGVIPIEWDVVKTGEILNVQTGKMNAQDQVDGGAYPFFTRSIDVQTIDTYAYDTEALFIAGEGNFKVKYYNGKFNCHQRTYMLTSINDNNMKFLLNAIQPKVNKLIATSVGSTVQSLRKPIIEALKIPLPPLKEQEKIADILSTADDKIDAIATQIQKAEILKKGLLQNLLSEGIGHSEFKDSELGKIPESWKITLLDKVSKRGTGHTPNKKFASYWNGGIKWVSLSDSSKMDDRYIYNTDKEISTEGIKNSSATIHPKDTVILVRDAGVGKSAILSEDMAVSQHFIAWVCNQDLDYFFLYYWLQSKKTHFEHIAIGSTIKTIGMPYFKKLKLPLPPFEEQKQISTILSIADDKLEILRAKKEKYETLKKGLLQKLLSGEIRV